VKLRVLWFGRRGSGPWDEQVDGYRRRVEHRWPAEDRVLKPVAGGRAGDPRRVLREEALTLERVLEPGWQLATLDQGGRVMTSEAFASWLADLESRSTPGLDLVIGSDLGLDRELIRRANLVLSLSAMTLPHQLARVLVWEQLFRATHILGGGGYHRPNVQ
jgi:23S rRNA (pseudouridine1915-N3)-methyltransferase